MSESVHHGMMALLISRPRSSALAEAAMKRSERVTKMKAGRQKGNPVMEAVSEEAVVDKKVAKIIRNRENAARIRREKKEEAETLQMEHQSLTQMVSNLQDENQVLQERIGKIPKMLNTRVGQPGLQWRAPSRMTAGRPTDRPSLMFQDTSNV